MYAVFYRLSHHMNKLLAASLIIAPFTANATFSMVAYDEKTGEFGSALASCIFMGENPRNVVLSDGLSVIVPDKGVFTTQAYANPFKNHNLTRAKVLIEGDTNPDNMISSMINNDSTKTPEVRQHLGMSKSSDGTVKGYAHSGADIENYAGHIIGDSYVIAGNTLDKGVLEAMQKGFTETTGSLKQKLLAALLEVKGSNIGDNRCTEYGVTSHTAFIKVGSYSVNYNSKATSEDAVDGLIEAANK